MARRSGRRCLALLVIGAALRFATRTSSPAFAAPQCAPVVGPEGSGWGLRTTQRRPEVSQISKQSIAWGCGTASEPIRHGLHFGLKIQQFWDHWIGPVNLDRQGLRISGIDTYAVVATVMLQVVVGFYGGVAQPPENCTRYERIMYDIQMSLMMVATLCSTFTMVIFLLNKIIDVTALGLYKDVSYATFMHVTRGSRMAGFWSLIVSMWSFLIVYAIDVFRRVQGKRGKAAKYVAIVMGCVMSFEWSRMMLMANRYLFNGVPRVG